MVDDAFRDMEGLEVLKVKAHRSKAVADQLRGQELRDYVGNDLGDRQAKKGAALSAPNSWTLGTYNDKWNEVKQTLKLVGDVTCALGTFNDAEVLEKKKRVAKPKAMQFSRAQRLGLKMHRPTTVSGGNLECKDCGRQASTILTKKRFHCQACTGVPVKHVAKAVVQKRRIAPVESHMVDPDGNEREFLQAAGTLEPRRHDLYKLGDYTFCWICGAHGHRKAYKLGTGCLGVPPNSSATDRRNRLRKGCHPLEPNSSLGIATKLSDREATDFLIGLGMV